MKQTLPCPVGFSLRSVILSHGWSDLPPFVVSDNRNSISFAFQTKTKPVFVKLSQNGNQIEIETSKKLSSKEIATIQNMLGMNREFQDFFDLAHQNERSWIHKYQMGRMLRGQTVFEDLIKLILTTNCTWTLTKKMVGELCIRLGEKVGDTYCFPTPQTMAKKNEAYYRNVIRTGYRSPHLPTISKWVASGKLDLESWNSSEHTYDDLRKKILALPGAGPYVAENLLRLLGKFDGLGVDSWVRGRLKEMWNMKKPPTDKKILQRYKNFNQYKGLILWCDVTRDWHEPKKSSRSTKIS